jgi:choline dehydrogenase-like flavoprotein
VANGGALQNDIRDPRGTTHHDTTNCYVVGPALLPATGSPNPMLTGVAIAARTATLLTDSVMQKPLPFN